MPATPQRLTLDAPAKLNLYLAVQGRRTDGFHELVTVMQTLDLADVVAVTLRPRRPLATDTDASAGTGAETGADVTLSLSGMATGVPAGSDNLAMRAASAWLDACDRRDTHGVDIALEKIIPPGGGLGGGSSDAAAVLRALAQLGGGPDENCLHSLAAELGSDVPFFLVGGTALCTGRGERVTPLPAPRRFAATLLLPGLVVPTPAVYAALDAPALPSQSSETLAAADDDPQHWARRLTDADSDRLDQLYRNDLETPATSVAPSLTDLLALPGMHLSGSGSTLFAYGPPNPAVTGSALVTPDPTRADTSMRFVTTMSRNR